MMHSASSKTLHFALLTLAALSCGLAVLVPGLLQLPLLLGELPRMFKVKNLVLALNSRLGGDTNVRSA